MLRISMDALLSRLAQHGLGDEGAACRSLRATLAVLGERLVDDEAMALAEVVPLELAKSVENSEYDRDFSTEELYERVRRRGRTTAAHAKENTAIVLTALGECLSHDLRRRIARGLPEQAAELLLGGRELGRPPPHRGAASASGQERIDDTPGAGRPHGPIA